MPSFIEPLEARRLFAISALAIEDLSALRAEALLIKAHATAFAASAKSQNATLTADLNRLHASAGNKALLAKLKRDEVRTGAVVTRTSATFFTVGAKDVARILADLKKNSFKLAVDVTTLQTHGLANSAKIQAAILSAQTVDDADLDAIAAANSGDATTQNDTATLKNTLAGGVATADSDGAVVVAEVTKLLTDLFT